MTITREDLKRLFNEREDAQDAQEEAVHALDEACTKQRAADLKFEHAREQFIFGILEEE